MALSLWKKKIGLYHLGGDEGETLCGRAMLGNNYASKAISPNDFVKIDAHERCIKCSLAVKKQGGYGSIAIAQDFDRVKMVAVHAMNKIPKHFDQLFGEKISSLLADVEAEANKWLECVVKGEIHGDDS